MWLIFHQYNLRREDHRSLVVAVEIKVIHIRISKIR